MSELADLKQQFEIARNAGNWDLAAELSRRIITLELEGLGQLDESLYAPHTTSPPTEGPGGKYHLSRKGVDPAAALWLVNYSFYTTVGDIDQIPTDISRQQVVDLLITGVPDMETEEQLELLRQQDRVGDKLIKLFHAARDPRTSQQAIDEVDYWLRRLVDEGILQSRSLDTYLIDRRYLGLYEIVEHFIVNAQREQEAETLKDIFESVELGYWDMEEYIGPLGVDFGLFCSYVELLTRQGYVVEVRGS